MNGAPRTEILSPAGKKGVLGSGMRVCVYIISLFVVKVSAAEAATTRNTTIDRAGKSVKRGSDMLMERGRALIAGAG